MRSPFFFLLSFSLLVQLVASSCPIPSVVPPTSPTISTTWTIPVQGYGNTFGGKTAILYNGSPVSNTTTASTVKAYQWSTEQIIWMSQPFAGTILGYQNNRISFNLTALASNRWSGTTATPSTMTFSVDVLAVEGITMGEDGNSWYVSWGGSDLWLKGTCSSPCRVLTTKTLTTTLKTSTALKVDWTQTDPSSSLRLVVRLRTSFNPSTANNQYTLTNLALTRLAKSRAFANLLTKPSVNLPAIIEMPPFASGNFTQQVNCPHAQTGLKLWHQATTWGSAGVPKPNGVAFSLPANTKVLIDSCTFAAGYPTTPFGTITIPSTSQLIIGEGVTQLLVTNIVVQGRFLIGGPTCRLKSKLTITFHDSAVDLGGVCGRKALCVQSPGQLDIHGKLFDATWSRLAQSVIPGDDRFALQSAVNWEVGQQIALTSTKWDNSESKHEYEVRIIKAVQGKLVQVTTPFTKYHWVGVEYQSEAILLDRRVTLQGDAASDAKAFGGHVIAASQGAQMRLRGVKGFRMGQKNVLARYPFHFHMVKAAVNSYITDCSVYRSYYRCYTIHGTNNTRLSRNTAYDNNGHCYYIEDGVEENNVLEYNIAAFQRPITAVPGVPTDFASSGGSQQGITVDGNSNLVIPADIAAGGFYITNSYNTFTGNAASGGFAGFSFVNLPAPIGSHRGIAGLLSPQERPIKSFSGNTVHSTSWQWHSSACVYIGGLLAYKDSTTPYLTYNVGRNSRNTRLSNGTAVWLRLNNLQVGNCQMGLNHWGDRLELVNFEASDIQRSAQIFGTSWMDNAFINVNTTNPTFSKPRNWYPWTQLETFQYYDTWSQAIITRVTFKNLKKAGSDWGITAVEYSDVFKPQGIAAARAINWVNSDKGLWVHHQTNPVGSSRYFNIIDFDNTINNGTTRVRTMIGADDSEYFIPGNTGSTLIANWWKIRSDCVEGHPAWNVTVCPIVDWRYQVASINIIVNGYIVGSQNYASTDYAGTITRWSTTARTIITRNPIITGPIGPKIGWFMWLKKGTPHKFSIETFSIPYVDGKGYANMPFAVPYPKGLQTSYFTVEVADKWAKANGYNGKNLTAAASAAAVYADNTGKKFFYESGTGYLYLNLVADFNPQGWGGSPKNFIRGGATLFDRCNSAYYITLNSCPGCSIATSDNGINYYTPGTLTPPSNAVLPA